MKPEATVNEREVRDAVQTIIDRLLDFDEGTRLRIFRTAETFFGFGSTAIPRLRPLSTLAASMDSTRATSFADHADLNPKDFLAQKSPLTDVERVVCLAYYLAHYRNTQHFKTIDISLLSTEAAQVKFSNTAYAVANAVRAGLLVPGPKGTKQLSAPGEQYVEALPDRATAKEILSTIRSRRGRKALKNHKNSPEESVN